MQSIHCLFSNHANFPTGLLEIISADSEDLLTCHLSVVSLCYKYLADVESVNIELVSWACQSAKASR